MFLLVALVPIAGLGIVSARLVSNTTRQAESAQSIAETTALVNNVIRLQSQITAESFTANAVASASSLGVPLSVVARVTGLDLEAYHRDAVATVDASLAVGDFGETADLLAQARALVQSEGVSTDQIADAYGRVEDEMGQAVSADLRELTDLTAAVIDTRSVTESLRILELSILLRENVTAMTKSYFGARFAVGRPSNTQAEILFQEVTHYNETLEQLKRVVPPGSPLKDAWNAVDSEPAVIAIRHQVDELIAELIATGAASPAFGSDVSLTDVSGNTQTFLDSLETIQRHAGFVDDVALTLATAADDVRAEAEASKDRTVALAFSLGAAAALAGVIASWWIVRPLRRMAEAVNRLQEGHLGDRVREAGPREVRSAAKALNDAVEHLSLAEQQTAVLARAHLDHPILERRAPGPLGLSLQNAVASLAHSLSEREEFRQRLAHEARHDGLTGLLNRASTMSRLEQALARVRRTDQDLAVLFIDLDDFKGINDELGHAAGDSVLRILSQRMAKAVRQGDHLGRLGGDEFVVIAEPVRDGDEALAVARRILEGIRKPIDLGEAEVVRTASIGIALIGQNDLTADEILRDADLAVYKAKAEGRATIEFCSEDLKKTLQDRVEIEHALRQAIDRDELELHYQPIVAAETHAPIAVEALLRWPNAAASVSGTEYFISIAERSDLIVEIDCWVVAKAVRQLKEWDSSPALKDLRISVNLSARHLGAHSLLHDILDPIQENGVDPSRLMIEITETALLNDIERASDALRQLRSHGIRIAIDDFGTGYTSLSHLRRLPIDVVKIDRSFVSNLDHADDRSLVSLIVDTGHLMGISITAEGVETEDQVRELTEMGTDSLQGYFYARPVSADSLAEVIGGCATVLRA